jgi:hypothetical protein
MMKNIMLNKKGKKREDDASSSDIYVAKSHSKNDNCGRSQSIF